MSKNILKQECLVAYYCTLQEMTKASIMYSAQEGDFQKKSQITLEADSYLRTGLKFKEELELDRGQYDKVREVAWTTFGGCYIRRSFIDKVGDFDPSYEWTYNRDVDYCLRGREAGERIYQIPVRLFHHESRDTKRVKDNSKAQMEAEKPR